MNQGQSLKKDDVFVVAVDNGKNIRMKLLRYINDEETEAEVEILSGPSKGSIVILSKELD